MYLIFCFLIKAKRMILKSCLILILIEEIVGISYNLPKFCSHPNWDENGITYKEGSQNRSIAMTIFITSNNSIYTIETKLDRADIEINGEDYAEYFSNYRLDSAFPYSMFITDDESIYLTGIGKIVKWTPETTTWQHAMFINGYCYKIFIDLNDTLYCSMYYDHKVIKIHLNDTENRTEIVAGTGEEGKTANTLCIPCGIFVDHNFNLYIADRDNHRIQLFRRDDLNGITVAGQRPSTHPIVISIPVDVVLDVDGYLYIVDQNNHRIVQSTPNDLRCLVGCDGRGSLSNQFSRPSSLSFDIDGNLYVVDEDNDRIQMFALKDTCKIFICL